MKLLNVKISLGLLIVLLPFLISCSRQASDSSDNLESLEQQFNNPGKEYRSAPLWVWNDAMNSETIDFMLRQLKDKGFGGAFVHPRPGLITEYLSNEWLELFKYSVEKGRELDMNIWIYDENSYPSGFGGGHVPAQMPESYNQGQGLQMTRLETFPDTVPNCFMCLMESEGKFTDISSEMAEFTGKTGPFYLFEKTYYGQSSWFGGYSYVDLLVPGVTQKFMDITMSGYEKVAGEEFGNLVPGVFTDEPEIPTPGGMRWTPDLFDVFSEKWGYDLRQHLPSLFLEVGDWKKIRHNYIETLLQMFINRWSKPWFEYCEQNNLDWTGHYWEHGWPNLAQGGDNMAMYAWHQMPAIDMLFNQFNENSPWAQFGNIRAVKEVRSVANQMGYDRTLCETYGGGGWEVTFKDLKRLGDWTYVLGINFMNQHLSHSTLKGARKYDYPPVFTYHSPWWPHYKPLNDYFARLSVALSMGEQQNDILILEPTTTLWNYYSYAQGNERVNEIGKEFQAFVTTLEKARSEYDLGSENIIKDRGSVSNGKFTVGERSYSKVVIPPMVENIEQSTFDLLTEFTQQGGKLVTFSSPNRLSGQKSDEVTDFFRTENPSIVRLNALSGEAIEKEFLSPGIQYQNVNGGNLYQHRRIFEDGQLIFLANASMETSVSGSLKLAGKTVLKLDAMTGEIFEYPSEPSGNNRALEFNIPPAGSLLLFAATNNQKGYKKLPETSKPKQVETSSPLKIKPLRDNALKIDFCDLWVGGKKYENIYFSKAADIAYQEHRFQGNPWNHAVQYKSEIVDRDTFSAGGFRVEYRFTVQRELSGEPIKISAERPGLFKVTVNGEAVNPIPGEWFLDKSFAVYDISNLVKKGENRIALQVSPMSVFAEIEPVYVLGNFSVVPAEKGWVIDMQKPELETGSWKEQGMPFYSWDVSYQKTWTLEDTGRSWKIRLPRWQGTVSEVLVNDEPAGIIAFDPFELDITDALNPGENKIEVQVTGSLKNLLGPHFKDPAPGLAGPGHWKNVEKDIPGKKYQMMDYGLLEDFQLISFEKKQPN